jgi:hypothetical protein
MVNTFTLKAPLTQGADRQSTGGRARRVGRDGREACRAGPGRLGLPVGVHRTADPIGGRLTDIDCTGHQRDYEP